MRLFRPEPLRSHAEVTRALAPERFVVVDGRRIHVTRAGSGRPLLLLHGLAASFFSFRELIPRLAEDYELITVDLNGFGLTERPADPDHYRIGYQVELLERVLDSLGVGKVSILGHSYGAAVAATLAKQHPGRCGRLVFVSPAVSFDPLPWYLRILPGKELFYCLVRGLLSDPGRYRRVAGRAFHVDGVFTEAVAEVYRSHLLVEGLKNCWHGFLRAMIDPNFPGSSYDGLASPVLVLAGACDQIVPMAKCEALVARIPGSRLETIPDCGHSAPEERPEVVATAVRDFLAER